jgi:hypothetical protein
MAREDEEEPFSCEAVCIGQTPKALHIKFPDNRKMWVPKSVVHDDSEVFDDDENKAGKLVVQGWFAAERGLE